MAAKKCQRVAEQDYVFEEPSIIVSFENSLNTEKGFLRLPIELQDEVLHYFQGVNIYTKTGYTIPILSPKYLESTDILRALSQVCVAYRRVFLPYLWESFTACIDSRSAQNPLSFYVHAGETLTRKCGGLSKNPDLAVHLR